MHLKKKIEKFRKACKENNLSIVRNFFSDNQFLETPTHVIMLCFRDATENGYFNIINEFQETIDTKILLRSLTETRDPNQRKPEEQDDSEENQRVRRIMRYLHLKQS